MSRAARHARAKLNLALRVLARETGGYHQIETIFCALEVADDVEVERSTHGIRLQVVAESGEAPDLGPTAENLAYRAAELFASATGERQGAYIRITKRIPAGAGLGGGSSDAAAVLSGLNEIAGNRLSTVGLMQLGARLGSDVPFFLSGAALALAWGRGDRVAPLRPLPRAPVLLAIPPERIATAEAYAALAAARGDAPVGAALLDVAPGSWSAVAAHAHNDFEATAFARLPRLRTLRDDIADAGALIARMTGSGSVLFGVFEEDQAAAAARDRLAARHGDVAWIVTRTIA